MAYTGAQTVKHGRLLLGSALERLQQESTLPPDVLAVVQNLAQAIGALFDAERASSDLDGRASVRHAMAFLSQTMALLQDVRSQHPGIGTATKSLAEVMRTLFPLASAASLRPPALQQPRPAAPAAASAARGPAAGAKRATHTRTSPCKCSGSVRT